MVNPINTPMPGVFISDDSSAILDGVRISGAGSPVKVGEASVICPKCGSVNVKVHRLRVNAGAVEASDLECLDCGERQRSGE